MLKTFLSVVKTKSFTKAAEENHCTQSTASLRIQSLEDYFGIRLFDRLGKSVFLTNPGERVLPYIELVVDTFAQAGELVLQIKKLSHGKISIISSQTPGTYIIPKILIDFHKMYPDITISSQIAYAKTVIELIGKENRFDLGIVSQPETVIEKYKSMNIEFKEIADDPLVIIVGRNHPWAKKGKIEISDLMHSTIFLSNHATSMIPYLQNITGMTIREESKMVIGNLESVKIAVQSSDGFAVVSGFNVEEELRSGVIKGLRLKGYDLMRKIYFISKKNKKFSPAVEMFMDKVVKTVRRYEQNKSLN
ncbi:MAG: LysR family transcriptional regulator [Thermodesulfobacteriota bacterium]